MASTFSSSIGSPAQNETRSALRLPSILEHLHYVTVYAIVLAAIAVRASKYDLREIKRDLTMKDVAYTFTLFHALAALAVLGFMLFSVVRLVSREKR
jgi:hypothetical protein